jgi:hypothetical protein
MAAFCASSLLLHLRLLRRLFAFLLGPVMPPLQKR